MVDGEKGFCDCNQLSLEINHENSSRKKKSLYKKN